MSPTLSAPRLGAALAVAAVLGACPVSAQNWPDLYDPLVVRTLNLSMNASDWNTVQHDATFSTELPAYLSLPGETPLLVAVRRKSSVALSKGGGSLKVGLKVDINQYIEQSWHGVKKLSLENGADTSTLLEGFAWYLHRLAQVPGGYPYVPGLASWVHLYVNGEDLGCYVNAEQVDKRFLENRGLWLTGDTWVYKGGDVGSHTLEFGTIGGSPTYNALCYSPFPLGSCPTPAPEVLAADLDQKIDMQGMLALGAVNAWAYSPDNLFSKGKNHFYADFTYRKRYYYSWDMDANFGSLNANQSIYELGNSAYEDLILDNAAFRPIYNNIMRTLINGPFTTSNLVAKINSLETAIGPALAADPYNPVGPDEFTDLRDFAADRNVSVNSQLPPATAVGGPAPEDLWLSAQPNPFQARTRIGFRVERSGPVRIAVYDARGSLVRTVADGVYPAGRHSADWAGEDEQGRRLRAGVYFVSYSGGGEIRKQRVVLLR